MVSKNNKVKKAVFPVAGLGTRFLPATKASPKEMLNVVDKPLIQYAAEEAVSAGFDTLIFVTGRNKVSIPNHFDRAYELESELLQKNKNSELELVQNILPSSVNCIYIRQKEEWRAKIKTSPIHTLIIMPCRPSQRSQRCLRRRRGPNSENQP